MQPNKLGFQKLLNIGIQLAAGVNAFHSRGYLHGDLKPDNVGYCTVSAAVKLLDLGRVKPAGQDYICRGGSLP